MRPRSAASMQSSSANSNNSTKSNNGNSNNRPTTARHHHQTNKETIKETDFFEDFTIYNVDGLPVEMTRFRGRVVIVTNIGTFAPNACAELEGFNQLANCFGENLAIIAVPSNHFFHEPTSNSLETLAVMEHVRPGHGFRPNPMSFFLTAKSNVNGADQLPLIRFLKRALPLPADNQFQFSPPEDGMSPFHITWSPVERSDITSDFEKFIVRPDGRPLRRYTGNYPSVNLYHDVSRLVEEFSLTAESARLSSARYSCSHAAAESSSDCQNGRNNRENSSITHKQQQQQLSPSSVSSMLLTNSITY